MQPETPENPIRLAGSRGLSARNCLTEEIMEDYLRGRLAESDSEQVEGHLLFCAPCQQLIEAEQEIYETLRGVARKAEEQRIAADSQARARRGPGWWEGVFALHRTRWFMAAGTVALAAAVFMVVPAVNRSGAVGPYSTIILSETRSGTPAAAGAARQPIVLRADLTGLESAGPLVVQAVDITGATVESQRVDPEGNEAVWRLRTGLPAGRYWIRVASAANPSATLREYALSIR